MIDSITHDPLPDYWTSVLFKKLVGTVSLNVQLKNKFLYAQAYCSKENQNDMTMMFINFGKENLTLSIPRHRHRSVVLYLLTAESLQSKYIFLNNKKLKLNKNDTLPHLDGIKTRQPFELPRRTYGFFAVKNMKNKLCSR